MGAAETKKTELKTFPCSYLLFRFLQSSFSSCLILVMLHKVMLREPEAQQKHKFKKKIKFTVKNVTFDLHFQTSEVKKINNKQASLEGKKGA